MEAQPGVSAMAAVLEHEEIRAVCGRRSGLPIIVAVHSTRLGSAAGGCRLWQYDSWLHGLADACRLAETMTYKFALAGLPVGGGKSVIALPPDTTLSAQRRRAAMLDLGDVVDGLSGRYVVGEDVGTNPGDMLVVRERTQYAAGLPQAAGGSGDPSVPTARGVFECIVRASQESFGWNDLAGHSFCVVGLGHVGELLARHLAVAGARLAVSDISQDKRVIAAELGAAWVDPAQALLAECEVLVPAALGGFLTESIVPRLRCQAVIGPANSQLADEAVAESLAERGILWGPDYLVNAGGAVYAVTRDLLGGDERTALTRMHAVADTFGQILKCAGQEGVTPYAVARRTARERLGLANGLREAQA